MKYLYFFVMAFVCLFYTPCVLAETNYEYDLCVCTVFKDDAPYLREWIEYHKLVGVQHFYLINNDSTDNYLDVLAPYIETDEVTLVDFSGGQGDWVSKVQAPAFLSAIDYYSGLAKWLAIIDTDEFIVPVEKDNLVDFLKDYEDYGAVVVNWQNYGTSWLPDIPPNKLLIESLILKADEKDPLNDISTWYHQVKSIVRPERVNTQKLAWKPHLWCYIGNYFDVGPDKKKFVWGTIDVQKVRINHYAHRTENYFYTHKVAKKTRMELKPSDEFIKIWHESFNKVEDKIIFKYVPRLRKVIFNEEN